MLGDEVRGERATYNSKKSSGYANLLDLIFNIRLVPVAAGHPVQHAPAVAGSPSLLLAAKTAPRAPWGTKWGSTTALKAWCHTGPLLGSEKTGRGKMPRDASCPLL